MDKAVVKPKSAKIVSKVLTKWAIVLVVLLALLFTMFGNK